MPNKFNRHTKPFVSPLMRHIMVLSHKLKREYKVPFKALELNEEEKENFLREITEARKDKNAWEKAIVKRDEARFKRLILFSTQYSGLPKNIRKSFNEGLLTPRELDTLSREMKQQYFNAYNIPELHAFYLMSEMHNYQKDLPPTKLNRERFFNSLKARVNAERTRIAKENIQLKKLNELENKLQKNISILGNPFSLGNNAIVATGGGLLSDKKDIPKFPEVEIKFSQPNTFRRSLVARRLQIPERKKADLAKREPRSDMGLKTFMTNHKLKNPVEFAKTYPKNSKDYKVLGFMNIRDLCDDMNVTPQEALLYICEGMTKTDTRWTHHRMNQELFRDSRSIVNIVTYFKDQVAKSLQDKNKLKYTLKDLHKSDYVKKIFADYNCTTGSYSQFTRWFKKQQEECEKLKLV